MLFTVYADKHIYT